MDRRRSKRMAKALQTPPASSASSSASSLSAAARGSSGRRHKGGERADGRAGRTPKKESYRQKMLDYALLLEFKRLQHQDISGVYVMPAKDLSASSPATASSRKWHGVIFCRAGAYREGVFKFKIVFKDYPERGPQFFFTSRVFNPLIHPETGELDMSIQFPEWDKEVHFIALALAYVKAVFYEASYWDQRARHPPFNREAARIWHDDKAEFHRRCDNCVRESQKNLFKHEPDSNLVFSKPDHNHSLILNRVKNSSERADPGFRFLDWFADGVRNIASYTAPRPSDNVEARARSRVPHPDEHSRENGDDDDDGSSSSSSSRNVTGVTGGDDATDRLQLNSPIPPEMGSLAMDADDGIRLDGDSTELPEEFAPLPDDDES